VGFQLNPEDLQAMAVGVLIHADSNETFEVIDAAERQWIRQDREANHRMVAAIDGASTTRRETTAAAGTDWLSRSQLSAIDERAAAASPGPWESFVEGRDHDSGDDFLRTGGADRDGLDLYVQHDFADQERNVSAAIADQDFIARARQDVPRLVAEVRRLRELVARRAN
jgi:hypothetical protein